MEELNIATMTVEQLESLGFRLVEQQTAVNNNLNVVQQELVKKRREAQAANGDQGGRNESEQSEDSSKFSESAKE